MVAPGTVDVLGHRLAIPGRSGAAVPTGSEVDVLVRPESITLRPAPNGPGVVARASFLGATVRVVASLSDGVEVSSVLPAGEGFGFPAGARVDIELLGEVLFVVAR